MIRSTITTTAKGEDLVSELLKRFKGAENAYVTIGIHEGAGNYQGPNAPSVVEVALWNEFGTRTSPERSWMRAALDGAESQVNEWRDEVIRHILDDGWTIERALETMGFRIQVLIQNRIKSNVPPPLAPATAAAKRREGIAPDTLIWSGLMLRSVTYRVHIE